MRLRTDLPRMTRIRTTHTGSLPRPLDLAEKLEARARRFSPDHSEFPNWAAQFAASPPFLVPTCEGPISYVGEAAAQRDIDNLRAALKDVEVEGAFLTAASPGVVALFATNTYYPDQKSYLDALSDAMKVEYDMIVQAGFLLQVDCPDLPINRDPAQMQLSLEALNRALRDIPPERMCVHLCWGNYAGPHNHDVPLRTIIEHPELVADRIERYASVVGLERVIAGVDCGFATFANRIDVDADIVWAKLRALADGARLASA